MSVEMLALARECAKPVRAGAGVNHRSRDRPRIGTTLTLGGLTLAGLSVAVAVLRN